MIEIIIMIIVGKQFYQLAKKYNQQLAWVYGILGVISYYGGAFIAGIIIGLYSEITGDYFLDGMNDLMLLVIFLPIGVLSCWGAYQLFKNKWHKDYLEEERRKPRISDIGKPDEEIKPTENFLIGNRKLDNLGKKKDDDWRF